MVIGTTFSDLLYQIYPGYQFSSKSDNEFYGGGSGPCDVIRNDEENEAVDTGIESSSHVFQEHLPCSFAYKIVSSVDPDFRGEYAAEKFVRDLQVEAKQLFDKYIVTPKPMLLTATESRSFESTAICHICANPLEDDKVRDHCHITGNYRGVAHNECNLMYRISKTGWNLPVVIHNLKGYDGHLIVKAVNSGR